MVSDVTEKAISEQNIETAGPPDVELLDLDPVIFKGHGGAEADSRSRELPRHTGA